MAKGDLGYEYVWDDERYRFATIEHRDMFSNPENRLVRDGRLYPFGNPSGGI